MAGRQEMCLPKDRNLSTNQGQGRGRADTSCEWPKKKNFDCLAKVIMKHLNVPPRGEKVGKRKKKIKQADGFETVGMRVPEHTQRFHHQI